MKRVLLFLLTNIAILIVITLLLSLTGGDRYLTSEGIDYQALLIFSAIIGFTGSFISLAISKWMAKTIYKINIIDTPKNNFEQQLFNTIQDLANKSGIPMPEVGIYVSPDLNAFATGPSKNNSLIAVSSALLENMNQDELEGVLGHEISHIANGDMVTLTLIQGVVNTFVVFLSRVAGFFVDKVIFKNDRNEVGMGYYIASFVFEIIFAILASLIVLYFSRIREFRADNGSAQITSKEKMIKALEKLKINHKLPQENKHPEMAALQISNRPSIFNWFSTHPSLDDRINALKQL